MSHHPVVVIVVVDGQQTSQSQDLDALLFEPYLKQACSSLGSSRVWILLNLQQIHPGLVCVDIDGGYLVFRVSPQIKCPLIIFVAQRVFHNIDIEAMSLAK